MLFIIFIIPETPRWLAAHDRNEDALSVLQQLNKGKMTDDQIQAVHREIVETVALETSIDSGSWKDLLHDDGKSVHTCIRGFASYTYTEIHSRRRLFIACSIQAFQQLGGINALICGSPTSYENVISAIADTYRLLEHTVLKELGLR